MESKRYYIVRYVGSNGIPIEFPATASLEVTLDLIASIAAVERRVKTCITLVIMGAPESDK